MTYLIDHSVYLDHIDIMQVRELGCIFDSIRTRQFHTVNFRIIRIAGVDEELRWGLGGRWLKTKIGFHVRARVPFVLRLMNLLQRNKGKSSSSVRECGHIHYITLHVINPNLHTLNYIRPNGTDFSTFIHSQPIHKELCANITSKYKLSALFCA